jgi:hypothetical protein
MPQQKLIFRPGVNTMQTATANEGGWSDANLVRFRQGQPEKWRGWVKYVPTKMAGVCRSLLAFSSLQGDRLFAAGTNERCYLSKAGDLFDVTPVDRTVAASSVAVTSGSTAIVVTTGATHGCAVGDWVTFDTISGQARTPSGLIVGGLTLYGDYKVTNVASGTVFTINAASAATSTAYISTGTVTCYLGSGAANATPGLGWGAAGWGVTAWNTPATSSSLVIQPRIWSLDAWGQTLLASPAFGPLYAWSPDSSFNVSTRLALVTNGTPSYGPPKEIGSIVVAMPERHVLALGASDLGATTNYDPMLVRWCTAEDYTTWNALATNSAGSFRLQGGTRIIAGWNTTLQTLIWTDTALHVCRFLGGTFIYGFTMAAQNCGILAPKAYAELNGAVYWAGTHSFWRYAGGSVERLTCTVEDTVFAQMTGAQQSKVTAGVNVQTGELIWFYPKGGSIECNAYVTYSPSEGVWSIGTLPRTAWLGHDLADGPVAAGTDGYLYQHETGVDANGAPMGDSITSGYADIDDGENLMLVTQYAPDFMELSGAVQVTFLIRDWPNSDPRVKGPFLINGDKLTQGFRARGRQMAIQIGSVGAGSYWRLGANRVNAQRDGKR